MNMFRTEIINPKAGLANLWQAERFSWHVAFTVSPISLFFTRPASLYCEEHVLIRMWLHEDCIWITVSTKSYCEWNIFTQIESGEKCWPDIYHWCPDLAVNERICDIGQKFENLFKQDVVAAPLTPTLSSLSYYSRGRGGLY